MSSCGDLLWVVEVGEMWLVGADFEKCSNGASALEARCRERVRAAEGHLLRGNDSCRTVQCWSWGKIPTAGCDYGESSA